MPDHRPEDAPLPGEPAEGDIMAGDRRIARTDTALPDWYASDGAYRPIPIVWFAGALVLQVVALPVLVGVVWGILGLPGLVTVAVLLLATGMIWHLTWERGMKHASIAWRAATGVMLATFFGLTALGVLA